MLLPGPNFLPSRMSCLACALGMLGYVRSATLLTLPCPVLTCTLPTLLVPPCLPPRSTRAAQHTCTTCTTQTLCPATAPCPTLLALPCPGRPPFLPHTHSVPSTPPIQPCPASPCHTLLLCSPLPHPPSPLPPGPPPSLAPAPPPLPLFHAPPYLTLFPPSPTPHTHFTQALPPAAKRQTLLFSATMTPALIKLQKAALDDAYVFQVGGKSLPLPLSLSWLLWLWAARPWQQLSPTGSQPKPPEQQWMEGSLARPRRQESSEITS